MILSTFKMTILKNRFFLIQILLFLTCLRFVKIMKVSDGKFQILNKNIKFTRVEILDLKFEPKIWKTEVCSLWLKMYTSFLDTLYVCTLVLINLILRFKGKVVCTNLCFAIYCSSFYIYSFKKSFMSKAIEVLS